MVEEIFSYDRCEICFYRGIGGKDIRSDLIYCKKMSRIKLRDDVCKNFKEDKELKK